MARLQWTLHYGFLGDTIFYTHAGNFQCSGRYVCSVALTTSTYEVRLEGRDTDQDCRPSVAFWGERSFITP